MRELEAELRRVERERDILKKALGLSARTEAPHGAPRVGDEKFASTYAVEVPNHWRFEHIDATHLAAGKLGYVETVDRI